MNKTVQKNLLKFISKYINVDYDKYVILLIHEKDVKLAMKYFPNYYKIYEKIAILRKDNRGKLNPPDYFHNSEFMFDGNSVKDNNECITIDVNKNFECQLCCEKLNSLISLKEHLLGHETFNVKTICSSSSRNGTRFESTVRKRIRSSQKHYSSNTVKDGKCSENHFSNDDIEKFQTAELNNEGIRKNQGESSVEKSLYNCELCNEKFCLSSELVNHLSCHKLTCEKFRKSENVNDTKNPKIGNSTLENQNSLSCYQNENRLQDSLIILDRNIKNCETDSSTININDIEVLSVRDSNVYTCKLCHETFDSSSLMNEHLLTHEIMNSKDEADENENSVFPILECTDVNSVNDSVSNVRKISVKNFHCDICKSSFKYKWTLQTHMMRHIEKNPFLCHICGKTFNNKSSIFFHIKHVHYGIKEHKCEFCNKNFPVRSSLKIHLRKHTGEKPFMCDVCGKTFPSSTALKIHEKSHSSKKLRNNKQTKRYFPLSDGIKKTHACDICGRCFRYPRDVRRHRSIHSTERPFLCPFCPLSFNVEQNCKRHVDRHKVKIVAVI